MLLQNKLALITGAGGGLGQEIAHGFVAQGAKVILADINIAAAQRVADDITAAGGQAWAQTIDVTDRDAVNQWALQLREQYGAIDILINNAGISGRCRFDDAEQPAMWDRILRVNLDGVFNLTYAMIPALKETKGVIVNLASIVSFVSGTSGAAYIASKGAIRSLTTALARDFAADGIRVNAVAPGVMMTEMVAPQLAQPGGLDWFMSRAPMQRGGQPKEIVGPIVFLASEMASYVNGVILPVDGGFLSA